jgi:hypothetical protein
MIKDCVSSYCLVSPRLSFIGQGFGLSAVTGVSRVERLIQDTRFPNLGMTRRVWHHHMVP